MNARMPLNKPSLDSKPLTLCVAATFFVDRISEIFEYPLRLRKNHLV